LSRAIRHHDGFDPPQRAGAATDAGPPGGGPAMGEQRLHGGGHAVPSGPLRVILVGDTGLEARLRNDRRIEPVPVRSTLEAIGELMADEASLSAEAVTVLLSAEAAGDPEVVDDIASMRSSSAPVYVLGIGPPPSHAADAVDAWLPADGSIDDLLERVEQGEKASPAESVDAEMPLVETMPRAGGGVRERAADPAMGSRASGAVADQALVADVLNGRDVLAHALTLIRERSGIGEVRFESSIRASAAEAGPDAVRVVVADGERTLGHLVATPTQRDADQARSVLSLHADWLAGWLRLAGQNTALRRAAFIDPLTGAWNRRYCTRFLRSAITRARDRRHSLTVLFFDIDGFKGYNDRFGHEAGDEILCEVVRALRSVIRPDDRVCRIGGDEFVVIFNEPAGPRHADSKPPESVYVLTKRVQQKIRERKFPKLGAEAAGRLTISGGLATYPWDGDSADRLLHYADTLAMESKKQGKNAITLGPGAERICNSVETGADEPSP